MGTERSEGEELFARLKLLRFPSLGPVRHKDFRLVGNRKYWETEAEAVMTSGFGEEPGPSLEMLTKDHDELVIAVHQMFTQLTEDEQWIYHMLVDVGLSMRFVARMLGVPKTTFARRRDELAEKMRKLLLEHEVVRKKLGF